MDTPFENSKSRNELKKIYVCCNNNSSWTPEIIQMMTNTDTLGYKFSAEGVISYKLIGKCHLQPDCFNFVEFMWKNDGKTGHASASKLEIEFYCGTEPPSIAKSENNENALENESANEEEEEEEKLEPASINNLDDICLIKIFLDFPMEERLKLENVCTRWQDVSQNAWSDVRELGFQLMHNKHGSPQFFEELLMRCGSYLNTLKIDSGCSYDILQVIPKYCHNLTTFEFNSLSSDCDDFSALSKMTKLQSFKSKHLDSGRLKNCLLSLPETITSIDISAPCHYDLKGLPGNVISRFNALDSLTIESYILRKDLIEAISEKKTIIKLNLSRCKIEEGLNLITNLINLRHLNLADVQEVDNKFIRCLVMRNNKLKSLNLSNCKKVTD